MAEMVVISCPQCKKQVKVPANSQGKKVKCPGCKNNFTVPGPSGIQTKPGPKPPPKKAPGGPPKPGAPYRAPVGDDDDDGNPYVLTKLEETPRCPHCAQEMESAEAVVCLHCGFNTQTRSHLETKKTIEPTGQEQFMWLLPGILCVLLILILFGHGVYLLVQRLTIGAPGVFNTVWNGIFGEPTEDDTLRPRAVDCCVIWWLISYGFGIYLASRFAVKRLILQPKKPEHVKEK